MASNGSIAMASPLSADAELEQSQTADPASTPSAGVDSDAKPKEKDLFSEIYEAKKIHDVIPRLKRDIQKMIASSAIGGKYRFLFLYDDGTDITRGTSNRLYSALGSQKEKKPLYLLPRPGICCRGGKRRSRFSLAWIWDGMRIRKMAWELS